MIVVERYRPMIVVVVHVRCTYDSYRVYPVYTADGFLVLTVFSTAEYIEKDARASFIKLNTLCIISHYIQTSVGY